MYFSVTVFTLVSQPKNLNSGLVRVEERASHNFQRRGHSFRILYFSKGICKIILNMFAGLWYGSLFPHERGKILLINTHHQAIVVF